MRRSIRFLWLLSMAAMLCAQDFRATLNGVVTDVSGAVVPNATIEVTNPETGEVQRAHSMSRGDFAVPFLRPGTYTVTAESAGFKKVIRENIVLRQGQSLSVSLTLEPGGVSESVTVSAESPLLETEKADRGTIIDNTRITEFPISGRNPIMLARLVPGVNFRGGSQRAFDNGSINNWSINGSPDSSTEFLLDGAPNNAQAGTNNIALVPSVDAVQEFRIHSNIYDAQYGKTGGGIVSVTLKSGTNEFHGTVFDFLRRGGWSANSFANNRNGASKGDFKLDQYGGQAGGPVRIPGLYNGRNRSFFMVSYEKYKDDDPRPFTGSVAAPEFLDGDFSKLKDAQGRQIVIYDPATGRMVNGTWVRDPFPGNLIPKDRINPIARNILNRMAKPTRDSGPNDGYAVNNLFQPGGVNNWTNDFYNFAVKADHNFNESHRMFFRFATNDRQERKNTNGIMEGPGQGESQTSRVNDAYTMDYVGVISPTLLFNLRGSYNRFVQTTEDRGNFGFDITQHGFPQSLAAMLPNPQYFGRYNYSGYVSQGFDSRFNTTNNYSVHPTVTWIRSAHTVKAGLDYRIVQYGIQDVGNLFFLDTNTVFTQRDYTRGDTNPSTGNSIASFLLGAPTSGSAEYRAQPFFSEKYLFPYIQDDWKVTRRLTLNLGFRMDFDLPPTERFNRMNNGFAAHKVNPVDGLIDRKTYPDVPELKGGMQFAGSDGVARRASSYKKTFQPRIGVAYRLTDSVVIRGGYGRAYMNFSNSFMQTNGFTFVNSAIMSLDSNRTPRPEAMTNPFPAGVLAPAGASTGLQTFLGSGYSFVSDSYNLPYIDQFSAGFQIQLPLQSVLDISYVGSRGHDLESSRPFNEIDLDVRQKCNLAEGGNPAYCNAALPNPFRGLDPFRGSNHYTSNTLTRAQLTRPYPHFGGLTELTRNEGASWFDSMQVSWETRRKGGLNLIASYTLSKMIVRSGWQDLQRGIMDRSLAAGDQPHRVTLGAVYALPFGPGKALFKTNHPVLGRIIGGWETNTMFNAQSGTPLSFSGNVLYVKDARLPDVDYSAEVVRVLQPCVARWNDNGTITMLPYSSSYGCTEYNFLIMPSYSPDMGADRDGRLRSRPRTNIDFSLNKSTQINDRFRVQFRAEAFNLTNTPLRPSIDMNPASTNFGVAYRTNSSNASSGAGSQGAPRTIQFGLKFIF